MVAKDGQYFKNMLKSQSLTHPLRLVDYLINLFVADGGN
jgi:hypothetical protein